MGQAKPINLRAGPGLGPIRAYIFEPIIMWAGLGLGLINIGPGLGFVNISK